MISAGHRIGSAFMILLLLTLHGIADIAFSQDTGPKIRTGAEKERVEYQGDRGLYKGWRRDTGGVIKLLRAAELRQEERTGGAVSILERDVKIIQDSLTIWCDEAWHWKAKGKLELRGNVIMVDPDRRLEADRVIYYEADRQTIARGNVVVTRDSVKLSSRLGEYNEQQQVTDIDRDMVIEDLRRDVVLTGDHGTWNNAAERGEVPRNPLLVQYDSTGAEEARIRSLFMEYDAMGGFAFARDSVRIQWGDVLGHCDELTYYPEERTALMLGNPKVWRERDEAEGDSIWLYVTEGKLDSTVIFGRAVAYTPSDSSTDSPRSELHGRRIVMDFEEGRVARLQSDGQATGIYHLFEKGIDQGSNKVTGDRVTLLMGDGTLTDVLVVGGTEGTFLPPRLAREIRGGEGERE